VAKRNNINATSACWFSMHSASAVPDNAKKFKRLNVNRYEIGCLMRLACRACLAGLPRGFLSVVVLKTLGAYQPMYARGIQKPYLKVSY